jgi:serine/threonine protein kinase
VVAIKKLHDFDWFNMETVEEFRREAALAQLLSNHPNVPSPCPPPNPKNSFIHFTNHLFPALLCAQVVNFVGACSCAPNFCMVSEFCDLGSLESVLRGRHAINDLPLKTIVRIARDAAAGTPLCSLLSEKFTKLTINLDIDIISNFLIQ